MTPFARTLFAATLLSTSVAAGAALAQTANPSVPPLPASPGGSTSSSSDDNGINPAASPGAGPQGTVMDSTKSGDDGAYARRNSGSTGTTGQGAGSTGVGGSGSGPLPERHPTER